jgi:hypothetical protein
MGKGLLGWQLDGELKMGAVKGRDLGVAAPFVRADWSVRAPEKAAESPGQGLRSRCPRCWRVLALLEAVRRDPRTQIGRRPRLISFSRSPPAWHDVFDLLYATEMEVRPAREWADASGPSVR